MIKFHFSRGESQDEKAYLPIINIYGDFRKYFPVWAFADGGPGPPYNWAASFEDEAM
jgi:hypothetical protein